MMERRGTCQLIVVVVSLSVMSSVTVTSSGVDDHHDYDDDVINAARCRVRCLSLLQVGYLPRLLHVLALFRCLLNGNSYEKKTGKTQ